MYTVQFNIYPLKRKLKNNLFNPTEQKLFCCEKPI